jgi:hypothetical protein
LEELLRIRRVNDEVVSTPEDEETTVAEPASARVLAQSPEASVAKEPVAGGVFERLRGYLREVIIVLPVCKINLASKLVA